MFALLLDLHRTHATTLVVVTHDATVAARADRVVTLRSGLIACTNRATPDALIAIADDSPPPFEHADAWSVDAASTQCQRPVRGGSGIAEAG